MGLSTSEGGHAGPSPPERPARLDGRLRAAIVAAVILPVLAVAAVVLALTNRPTGTPVPGGATIADFAATPVPEDRPAPAFDLPSLTGSGRVRLGAPGSVVVLNIWASWCDPCRREAPELEAAWRAYGPRGVRVVGVDHRDSRSGGEGFARSFGLTYALAFDPAGTVAARYGSLGVPTTFVIDRDGRIVERFLGRVDHRALDPILDRLLGQTG